MGDDDDDDDEGLADTTRITFRWSMRRRVIAMGRKNNDSIKDTMAWDHEFFSGGIVV